GVAPVGRARQVDAVVGEDVGEVGEDRVDVALAGAGGVVHGDPFLVERDAAAEAGGGVDRGGPGGAVVGGAEHLDDVAAAVAERGEVELAADVVAGHGRVAVV